MALSSLPDTHIEKGFVEYKCTLKTSTSLLVLCIHDTSAHEVQINQ